MGAESRRTPFETETDDGWTLRGDVLEPERPIAVAVLAHAMMVDRRTMDRPAGKGLASVLVEHGIAVIHADLRGHGESGPRADEGASYTYDDFVMHDLPALVAAARARFPRLATVLVGHSLGAHAAAISAGLDPQRAPDGIVSIAGNLWVPHLDPSFARRAVKRAMFHAWLAFSQRKGYFDPRPLKLGNTPEALAYIRQFVAMFDADRLMSADGTVDFAEALAFADVPILSIASVGDHLLAHPDCVQRFFDLARRAAVTHRLVRKGELDSGAPSHMGLVTDARSRPLWHEIAAWTVHLAQT